LQTRPPSGRFVEQVIAWAGIAPSNPEAPTTAATIRTLILRMADILARVRGGRKDAVATDYIAPTALPFRPGSMAWRVNMEPVIVLGGGRALLLQVLHPLVAAGVEQHSNFAQDPFRRGFRTADMMLKLAFGDDATSRRQSIALQRMHQRIKGTSPEGVAYDAMDPALLIWVWATLVEVSLLLYEKAVQPLAARERERYYEEQKLIAYACGVPEGACPRTYDDFREYMQRIIDTELRVTTTARVVAFAGRHPPLPRPIGRLAGIVGSFFTAALLPEQFRGQLGYGWSPSKERVLNVFFTVSRLLARVTPAWVRHLQNGYLIRRRTPLGWWRNRAIRLPDELAS
jgi:uncharacterized protein (DUF2236 family)